MYIFRYLVPTINHFLSRSTFIYYLYFPVSQIPPSSFSTLAPSSLSLSLFLLQIKLRCQLQKWNEPPFIFLALHKHKHVLICVAALTDLPVSAVWYRLLPLAGLKACRRVFLYVCVGEDVIKLILKLIQPYEADTWESVFVICSKSVRLDSRRISLKSASAMTWKCQLMWNKRLI